LCSWFDGGTTFGESKVNDIAISYRFPLDATVCFILVIAFLSLFLPPICVASGYLL